MRLLQSVLRIIALVTIAFIMMEILVPAEEGGLAVINKPILLLVLSVVLLAAIAIEVSVAGLRNMLFRTLKGEAREKYLQSEFEKKEKIRTWFREFFSTKPLEGEEAIVLDNDYDGIRELDNKLPPWWLYMFYISIVFAFGYMAWYHIFDGTSQAEEYEMEMAQAEKDIEEYKKNAPDLVDASTVMLLTDVADLEAGKANYEMNCIACHRADGGGGIGPNLADEHWIVDGNIGGVFDVISEGGRPGKGMIAWKQNLKPLEIAQVASYVLSLQGTNPPDAKEAEGDIWVAENE